MDRTTPQLILTLMLLLSLTLAACGRLSMAENPPEVDPGVTGVGGAEATPTVIAVAQAVETILASTPSPIPTLTPWPTPTQTEVSTLTPTPAPTLHPMMIEKLRQDAYPGSPITIERELEPGANYSRYYASYLSEGLKIYALLTVPYGDPPEGGWPAIVFNHGYIPPDVYRTTERYIAYVDGLARSGYIVFRIDYRGHDQSEGEASGAYGSPGYTADVLNAVASIKQFPQANPDKIGMWGHSMGGYLTLRSMVISQDVKVGVIWAGVVGSYPDMLYRWRRSNTVATPVISSSARRWRQAWLDEFGTPEENPAFWNAVSSNTYVGEISGPVQLHHGTNDESVPLEMSQVLNQQLLDAGKTVELHVYEGDNHNISNYFTQAMGRTIEFFDRYLK